MFASTRWGCLAAFLGILPVCASGAEPGECYRLDLEVAHNALFDWAARQGTIREALRGFSGPERESEAYDAHPATMGWHGVIPLLQVPAGLFPLAKHGDEVVVQFEPEGERLCVESLRLPDEWDDGQLFTRARVHGSTAKDGEILLTSGLRFELSPWGWEQLRLEQDRTKFISVLACRGMGGELVFLGLEFVGSLPGRPAIWK
jgi:hypothetical protein